MAVELLHGDCLDKMKHIESSSVDLILTDLPYGTISGIGSKGIDSYDRLGTVDWDNVIDFKLLFEHFDRILRKRGKILLFAQQPFTTGLINNAPSNIKFGHTLFWDKGHFANCLTVKKACVNYIEEILLFSKIDDPNDGHDARTYFEEQRQLIKHMSYHEINKNCFGSASNGGGMASNILTPTKKNWTFPTKEKYEALQSLGICLEPYEKLKVMDNNHKVKFASTFNLWEGEKYKSNLFKYKKDYTGHHPTQKPVKLLEDLIKTYSNENDLVVDATMGSGSTGVACKNTNRNFIGIERDDEYFDIASKRINKPRITDFS